MLRTLSEIAAICQAAARGLGLEAGVAEEAGHFARLLASFGLPGPESLLAGMRKGDDSGLAVAIHLSDRLQSLSDGRVATFGPVGGPLLILAPLAIGARRLGDTFVVTWEAGGATCAPQGIAATPPAGGWPLRVEAVRVERGRVPAAVTPARHGARPVDPETWAALEALAAETLVPETAESRATGAGDGSGHG